MGIRGFPVAVCLGIDYNPAEYGRPFGRLFLGSLSHTMLVTAPAPPILSDAELLARFTAGDREALEALFQRHRLPAYRIAYRLLGNEADALDATQEGFIKVLTHLGSFQGLFKSKDNLLNWTHVQLRQDIGRIGPVTHNYRDINLFGRDGANSGAVYKTTDSGANGKAGKHRHDRSGTEFLGRIF